MRQAASLPLWSSVGLEPRGGDVSGTVTEGAGAGNLDLTAPGGLLESLAF